MSWMVEPTRQTFHYFHCCWSHHHHLHHYQTNLLPFKYHQYPSYYHLESSTPPKNNSQSTHIPSNPIWNWPLANHSSWMDPTQIIFPVRYEISYCWTYHGIIIAIRGLLLQCRSTLGVSVLDNLLLSEDVILDLLVQFKEFDSIDEEDDNNTAVAIAIFFIARKIIGRRYQ